MQFVVCCFMKHQGPGETILFALYTAPTVRGWNDNKNTTLTTFFYFEVTNPYITRVKWTKTKTEFIKKKKILETNLK